MLCRWERTLLSVRAISAGRGIRTAAGYRVDARIWFSIRWRPGYGVDPGPFGPTRAAPAGTSWKEVPAATVNSASVPQSLITGFS